MFNKTQTLCCSNTVPYSKKRGENLPFLLYLHGVFNLADDIEVNKVQYGEFQNKRNLDIYTIKAVVRRLSCVYNCNN